jgi:hypothetical protein
VDKNLSVIQPFHPNNGRAEFRVLPETIIVIDGEWLESEQNIRALEIVEEGITHHPKAKLWKQ